MNNSDKVYTEIYKVESSVAFSIIFLGSSKGAAVVLCLHHSVKKSAENPKQSREDNGKIITYDL